MFKGKQEDKGQKQDDDWHLVDGDSPVGDGKILPMSPGLEANDYVDVLEDLGVVDLDKLEAEEAEEARAAEARALTDRIEAEEAKKVRAEVKARVMVEDEEAEIARAKKIAADITRNGFTMAFLAEVFARGMPYPAPSPVCTKPMSLQNSIALSDYIDSLKAIRIIREEIDERVGFLRSKINEGVSFHEAKVLLGRAQKAELAREKKGRKASVTAVPAPATNGDHTRRELERQAARAAGAGEAARAAPPM